MYGGECGYYLELKLLNKKTANPQCHSSLINRTLICIHSISLQFGVAVNVFWRHLEPCYYDSKDTYGNKDLVPATRAMQIMDRAIKALEELPEEYRDFYARRIVCKVKDKCYDHKHDNSFTGSLNGAVEG